MATFIAVSHTFLIALDLGTT